MAFTSDPAYSTSTGPEPRAIVVVAAAEVVVLLVVELEDEQAANAKATTPAKIGARRRVCEKFCAVTRRSVAPGPE
jgi:hypothetical protein